MSEPAYNTPRDQAAMPSAEEHSRGLWLIGLFKLSKSIFFFFVGVGAFHFINSDLSEFALHVARALRFDPEGRVVNLLLEKIDLIDAHRLREIGVGTLAYSALALLEGYGLVRERVWAEYLTLGLTVSFLPWELYELARSPNLFRLSLLLINLAVLTYLLWFLQRKKKREPATQPALGKIVSAE